MSYELLLKRIAERRAAASPGPWTLEDGFNHDGVIYGGEGYSIGQFEFSAKGAHIANAALAVPAHEMAACVTALVEAAPIIQALWGLTGVKRVEGGRYECLFNCHIDARGMHSPSCPLVAIGTGMPKRIDDALDALAKAMGV